MSNISGYCSNIHRTDTHALCTSLFKGRIPIGISSVPCDCLCHSGGNIDDILICNKKLWYDIVLAWHTKYPVGHYHFCHYDETPVAIDFNMFRMSDLISL